MTHLAGTGGRGRARRLKVLLADNANWSQEQMDFAIKEASLQ